MTINTETIYEDYRNADFMNRLHIYLQFPELRNDFLEIDQTETRKDPFAIESRQPEGRSSVRKFLDRQLSFLKV